MWLLDGYKEYVRIGLDEDIWPKIALGKTKDFNDEISDVASFLGEVCVKAPDEMMALCNRPTTGMPKDVRNKVNSWCKITVPELLGAFKLWLGEGEKTRLGRNQFSGEVRGLGINMDTRWFNGKSSKVFLGLKIDPNAQARIMDHRRSLGDN